MTDADDQALRVNLASALGVGHLDTRLDTATGRVTILRADPVILIHTELLAALRYCTGKHGTEWVPGWVDMPPSASLLREDDDPAPHMPTAREEDGTMVPLVPDYTGARLRVTAENMIAVYVITGYAGHRTWRAAWPD
jgi:hypothetical protein